MPTPNIRVATLADLDLILYYCKEHHANSPYRSFRYSAKRTRGTVIEILNGGGIVLLSAHGLLIAQKIVPHFSDEEHTAELIWWSFALPHEAKREMIALFNAYEYWARKVVRVPVIHCGIYGDSRFLQKNGFVQLETGYMKRLR